MEVSGWLHAPTALPLGKECLTAIVMDAGWASEWWQREKILSLLLLRIQPYLFRS